MKTFYVDFTGWCEIKAKDANEAKEIFWKKYGLDEIKMADRFLIDEIKGAEEKQGEE